MMSDGVTVRATVVMSGSGTEMSDAIAIGVTRPLTSQVRRRWR